MWIDNTIYNNDLNRTINDSNINLDLLRDKTILVSGGTGLIGSTFVNVILYANIKINLNCTVIVLARDIRKAKHLYRSQFDITNQLIFIESDILDINLSEKISKYNIDYILHAASQTSSKGFVDSSIDAINVSYSGTKNMLELAKTHNVKRFVYLSTMEVYGVSHVDDLINEESPLTTFSNNLRNSYPIGKIASENLCFCYASTYGFLVKVLRLTQTFGPGISKNDDRVYAQFINCIINKNDIVLCTQGHTKRSYLYTFDAVRAIILSMTTNDKSNIYNVANPQTYISIYEMAQLVSTLFKERTVRVVVNEDSELVKMNGYADYLCLNLDSSKLQSIGWRPFYNLDEMYLNAINSILQDNEGNTNVF